ncbi:hypothetical protein BC332_21086 [Capsicum chinense]|nr:hypothetical protein BC332_21086 [Capsicum chinense]
MLRCLYNDMIEVEAIQPKVNRRIIAVKNMGFDQNLKSKSSKKRRDFMNVAVSSCLGEGQGCWKLIYMTGCTMVALITYCFDPSMKMGNMLPGSEGSAEIYQVVGNKAYKGDGTFENSNLTAKIMETRSPFKERKHNESVDLGRQQ